jgi:hypothetical protein
MAFSELASNEVTHKSTLFALGDATVIPKMLYLHTPTAIRHWQGKRRSISIGEIERNYDVW